MKPTWKDVRARLSESGTRRPMRDADSFWADFRARARLVRQEAPAAPRRRAPAWARPAAWVTAAAAAAALAILIRGMPVRPPVEIKALEVVASHSAVLIMNDSAERGTIVWIADLDLNAPQEGG